MDHPSNPGLGRSIDLNENPSMPDITGIRNPISGQAASLVSIGNFNINTSATATAASKTMKEALCEAQKDSSNE